MRALALSLSITVGMIIVMMAIEPWPNECLKWEVMTKRVYHSASGRFLDQQIAVCRESK